MAQPVEKNFRLSTGLDCHTLLTYLVDTLVKKLVNSMTVQSSVNLGLSTPVFGSYMTKTQLVCRDKTF
jgi:hypothetical protein